VPRQDWRNIEFARCQKYRCARNAGHLPGVHFLEKPGREAVPFAFALPAAPHIPYARSASLRKPRLPIISGTHPPAACASPKLRTSAESMTWGHACAVVFSLIFPDVCPPSTSARLGRLRVSLPRRTPVGEPRPSATTAGSARQATSPATEFRRQAVLGHSTKSLVWLEKVVDPSHSADRGSLASDRLSTVLELDLANSKTGRKETDQQGSARPDLSHGRGEPNVGSAPNPRGTAQTGIRHLRTNHISLGQTSKQESRSSPPLAGVSQESACSNRCHGLLHRAHAYVRCPVLFLCNQP